jgi:hypothetical protein
MIDDKLATLLAAKVLKCADVNPQDLPTTARLVDEIEALFLDAGWTPKPEVDVKIQRGTDYSFQFSGDMNALKKANGFMTGQEWYDGFDNEIHKPWTDEYILEPQHSADEQMDYYTAEHVIESAKKAAGME